MAAFTLWAQVQWYGTSFSNTLLDIGSKRPLNTLSDVFFVVQDVSLFLEEKL